mgnify:CR=1 FL=1
MFLKSRKNVTLFDHDVNSTQNSKKGVIIFCEKGPLGNSECYISSTCSTTVNFLKTYIQKKYPKRELYSSFQENPDSTELSDPIKDEINILLRTRKLQNIFLFAPLDFTISSLFDDLRKNDSVDIIGSKLFEFLSFKENAPRYENDRKKQNIFRLHSKKIILKDFHLFELK